MLKTKVFSVVASAQGPVLEKEAPLPELTDAHRPIDATDVHEQGENIFSERVVTIPVLPSLPPLSVFNVVVHGGANGRAIPMEKLMIDRYRFQLNSLMFPEGEY